MTITFFGAEKFKPSERSIIKRSIQEALGSHKRIEGELCVIFVSSRKIRKINNDFLGHDYATDVIAFPYTDYKQNPDWPMETPETRSFPWGDIYISLDVARRQARELGHPLAVEAATLAVHGTLHLVGYDDRRPADKRRMFAKQDRIVRKAFPAKRLS